MRTVVRVLLTLVLLVAAGVLSSIWRDITSIRHGPETPGFAPMWLQSRQMSAHPISFPS